MLSLFTEYYRHHGGVTEKTAVAWEWALDKVSDERLMWAARQIVEEKGRTFFPTPNEVKAYLSDAVEHGRSTKFLTPGEEGVGDAVAEWYRNGGPARLREKNTELAKQFPLTRGNLFG